MLYTVILNYPSNIIKHMSFEYICTFILYYVYIQYIHLISVTLLQNNQNGEHFKKAKRNFSCFAECKYAKYLLNQHR